MTWSLDSLDLPLYGNVDLQHYDAARQASRQLHKVDPQQLEMTPKATIPLEIELCWNIALSLGHIDQRRAMVFHWHAVNASLKSKDAYLVSRSMSMEAVFLSTIGTNFESQALSLAKAGYDLALNCQRPHAIGLARYGAGVTHFLYGRWGLASHFLSEAVRVFREECQGAVWEQSTAESFLVASLAAQGEFKDLIRRVPEILSKRATKVIDISPPICEQVIRY